MEKKAMFKGRIARTVLGGVSAYLVTMTALAGFGEVDASSVREMPSSICHASADNIGPGLDNGGAINNNTGGPVQVHCPVISDNLQSASSITSLTVFGNESTDGGYTAACSCFAAPLSCNCPSVTAWSNSSSGAVATLSATSLSGWASGRTTKFRWVLHNMTPGSTLIGHNTFAP